MFAERSSCLELLQLTMLYIIILQYIIPDSSPNRDILLLVVLDLKAVLFVLAKLQEAKKWT